MSEQNSQQEKINKFILTLYTILKVHLSINLRIKTLISNGVRIRATLPSRIWPYSPKIPSLVISSILI